MKKVSKEQFFKIISPTNCRVTDIKFNTNGNPPTSSTAFKIHNSLIGVVINTNLNVPNQKEYYLTN